MSTTRPSLLPDGASDYEHALGETQARISVIQVSRLASLWSPDDCPADLLGVLAWSMGADPWDPDWPEAVMRQALRDMPRIHAERGTWAAVDRVLNAFGAVTTIEEGPDAKAGLAAMQGRVRIHNSASLHGALAKLVAAVGRVQRLTFELQITASEGISGTIPIGGPVGTVAARSAVIA